MAAEPQPDPNASPADRRWPGPPGGGGSSRHGGAKPPPSRRPARRSDPGDHRRRAERPQPEPTDNAAAPSAVLDLTTAVIIDLRMVETPVAELVGATVAAASAEITAAGPVPSMSSAAPVTDTAVDAGGADSLDRPDDYRVDPVERDASHGSPSPHRPIWPEIRFYLGCAALFFVSFALATGLWVLAPAVVFGWSSAAITSGSMEPAIHTGDVVVFSATPDERIGPGTVIVFEEGAGSLVTHRIIGTDPDGSYVTRGDNNPTPDSRPVPHDEVRGVGRLLVPFAGFPALWMSGGSPWSVVAVAIGFGLLGYASRWALLARFIPWPVEQ